MLDIKKWKKPNQYGLKNLTCATTKMQGSWRKIGRNNDRAQKKGSK